MFERPSKLFSTFWAVMSCLKFTAYITYGQTPGVLKPYMAAMVPVSYGPMVLQHSAIAYCTMHSYGRFYGFVLHLWRYVAIALKPSEKHYVLHQTDKVVNLYVSVSSTF